MKTPKRIVEKKQLGFGSNLMKKYVSGIQVMVLIKLCWDGMNKDYQTNTSTQMWTKWKVAYELD